MEDLEKILFSAYQATAALSPVSIVTLSIGGHILQLSFAGEELKNTLLQSFHGAIIPESIESPSLKLYLWDAICGQNFICEELQQKMRQKDYGITAIDRAESHFRLNHEGQTLSFINTKKRIAFYFTPDVKKLPDYEVCCPMQMIIDYFCRMNKMLLVHAAGIGWNEKGILLIGQNGSGKSTTSLLSLLNGFSFLGDDHLILSISETGKLIGYPIYRGCKVMDNALEKLPQLKPYVIETNRTGKKNIVIINDTLGHLPSSLPIEFIVHPKVTHAQTSSFEKLPLMRLLGEFVGSTIIQIQGDRGDSFNELIKFSRQVPAYSILLSHHFQEIAIRLKKFLEQHDDYV